MLSGSRKTMSGPPAVSLDVLNARVRHAQGIKAVRPRFKSAEVAHTKGDMVESDPPLVKGRSIAPEPNQNLTAETPAEDAAALLAEARCWVSWSC